MTDQRSIPLWPFQSPIGEFRKEKKARVSTSFGGKERASASICTGSLSLVEYLSFEVQNTTRNCPWFNQDRISSPSPSADNFKILLTSRRVIHRLNGGRRITGTCTVLKLATVFRRGRYYLFDPRSKWNGGGEDRSPSECPSGSLCVQGVWPLLLALSIKDRLLICLWPWRICRKRRPPPFKQTKTSIVHCCIYSFSVE